MKKKLMMVAVLLGALSLGACVDNDESASVTAVRNAKAEQLKGLAALANAQAEATKVTAEAEAALKNAQAEYQKEMTEEAKQKFAVKIEQIKANAEKAIAAAKLEAAQNQQALLDLADERLRELYGEYMGAIGQLDGLNSQKLNATTALASLENGLISFKTQKDIDIARQEKSIANYNFQIGLYEKYEKVDKTELRQKATTLNKEWEKVNALVGPKETAKEHAADAFNESSPRFYADNYPTGQGGESQVENPIKTVASVRTFDVKGWWYVYTSEYKELSANRNIIYYTLVASEVERKKQELDNTAKNQKDYLGAPKAGETAATGLYAGLANAETNLENAKKADPVNQDNIDYWQGQVDQYKANIETAKTNLKDAEDDVKEFAALIATFAGDDLKAYDKAIEDQKVLAEAFETALKEYNDALDTASKAWTEYETANSLANAAFDVDGAIENLKYYIAGCEQQINTLKTQINSQEDAIASKKAELETIKTKIEAQTAIVNNWKAQIEAAIEAQK
ncbi:DUF4082 domain-containing protein [Bacteroides fragilis]|uniref:DUF4082 domain-containing protein n=1 Tax=Bacteroides fragilis TaxID=817 RepID=UPI002030AE57|nr:DUF4082 domain-containing protein [Bacteroides fragilis]MCM0344066.1 DUF4082 domain-containing protein [Bacteroides fragilis]